MIAKVVEPTLVDLAGEMAATLSEAPLSQVPLSEAPLSQVPLCQVTLPPSERDFEVYRYVTVEGESTRATAQVFGISQTRVIQIRDHVAEWIASEVPPLARATPAQRLAVGANLARERFDSLYCQAMEAWRESKGLPTNAHGAEHHCKSHGTRASFGDPRYVMLAARIAIKTVGLHVAIEKAAASGEESGVGDRESGEAGSKFNVG